MGPFITIPDAPPEDAFSALAQGTLGILDRYADLSDWTVDNFFEHLYMALRETNLSQDTRGKVAALLALAVWRLHKETPCN